MSFAEIIAQAQERLSTSRLHVDDDTDADIRVIVALLDLLDPESAKVQEDLAYLNELRARRARAWLGAGGSEAGYAASAETTTPADIDRLHQLAAERGEVIVRLVDVRSSVWGDFRSGARCMVCGMTKVQAAAANYNCTKEC